MWRRIRKARSLLASILLVAVLAASLPDISAFFQGNKEKGNLAFGRTATASNEETAGQKATVSTASSSDAKLSEITIGVSRRELLDEARMAAEEGIRFQWDASFTSNDKEISELYQDLLSEENVYLLFSDQYKDGRIAGTRSGTWMYCLFQGEAPVSESGELNCFSQQDRLIFLCVNASDHPVCFRAVFKNFRLADITVPAGMNAMAATQSNGEATQSNGEATQSNREATQSNGEAIQSNGAGKWKIIEEKATISNGTASISPKQTERVGNGKKEKGFTFGITPMEPVAAEEDIRNGDGFFSFFDILEEEESRQRVFAAAGVLPITNLQDEKGQGVVLPHSAKIDYLGDNWEETRKSFGRFNIRLDVDVSKVQEPINVVMILDYSPSMYKMTYTNGTIKDSVGNINRDIRINKMIKAAESAVDQLIPSRGESSMKLIAFNDQVFTSKSGEEIKKAVTAVHNDSYSRTALWTDAGSGYADSGWVTAQRDENSNMNFNGPDLLKRTIRSLNDDPAIYETYLESNSSDQTSRKDYGAALEYAKTCLEALPEELQYYTETQEDGTEERREKKNYVILMTDGEWNQSEGGIAESAILAADQMKELDLDGFYMIGVSMMDTDTIKYREEMIPLTEFMELFSQTPGAKKSTFQYVKRTYIPQYESEILKILTQISDDISVGVTNLMVVDFLSEAIDWNNGETVYVYRDNVRDTSCYNVGDVIQDESYGIVGFDFGSACLRGHVYTVSFDVELSEKGLARLPFQYTDRGSQDTDWEEDSRYQFSSNGLGMFANRRVNPETGELETACIQWKTSNMEEEEEPYMAAYETQPIVKSGARLWFQSDITNQEKNSQDFRYHIEAMMEGIEGFRDVEGYGEHYSFALKSGEENKSEPILIPQLSQEREVQIMLPRFMESPEVPAVSILPCTWDGRELTRSTAEASTGETCSDEEWNALEEEIDRRRAELEEELYTSWKQSGEKASFHVAPGEFWKIVISQELQHKPYFHAYDHDNREEVKRIER